MKKDLLHTPEGVRDIYDRECAEKEVLEARLKDVLHSYGYSDIQTPTFEFFDVFSKEKGSVPDTELYKFFDRYGHTLCLRPDMTPSIARTAAKYYGDRLLPVKLCYDGNTFVNDNKYYAGRLKENTMVGAELIGDDSLAADFEAIQMSVDCMKNAGLTEFQVEVGNVAFFNGLLNAAGIKGDDALDLLVMIQDKNFLGVEEVLDSLNIDKKISRVLEDLPRLFGSEEVLKEARELTDIPECLAALDRLEALNELLKASGYDANISFDLGEVSSHAYYTGIIFHAYTFGTGEPVLNGGRYDKLIAQFGVDKPSIGFSITVDRLLSALQRQQITVPVDVSGTLLICSDETSSEASLLASALRDTGEKVLLIHAHEDKTAADYREYAENAFLTKVYDYTRAGSVVVTALDTLESEELTPDALKGGN